MRHDAIDGDLGIGSVQGLFKLEQRGRVIDEADS